MISGFYKVFSVIRKWKDNSSTAPDERISSEAVLLSEQYVSESGYHRDVDVLESCGSAHFHRVFQLTADFVKIDLI